MAIGDLLVKVANQQPLTEIEKQQLRLWGNKADGNLSLVDKWATQPFTRADTSDMQMGFRSVGAKVSRSSSVSIADSTYTFVSWVTTEYQSHTGMFSTSDDTKIYIPKTGRYSVGQNIAFNAAPWRVDIYVNSTILASGLCDTVSPFTFTASNYSEDAILNAGDYVRISVFQASGVSKNLLAGNFFVRWIGTN